MLNNTDKKPGKDFLFRAFENNDQKIIIKAIKKKDFDINLHCVLIVNEGDLTFIQAAAYFGNSYIIQLLLENFSKNISEENINNTLLLVLKNQRISDSEKNKIKQILFIHGANQDIVSAYNKGVDVAKLLCLQKKDDWKFFSSFKNKKVDRHFINISEITKIYVFLYALRYHEQNVILLQNLFDHFKEFYQGKLLKYQIFVEQLKAFVKKSFKNNNQQLFHFLINSFNKFTNLVDLNFENNSGKKIPLIISAVNQENIELVEFLIQNGVNINVEVDGFSPMKLAFYSESKNKKLIEILKKNIFQLDQEKLLILINEQEHLGPNEKKEFMDLLGLNSYHFKPIKN